MLARTDPEGRTDALQKLKRNEEKKNEWFCLREDIYLIYFHKISLNGGKMRLRLDLLEGLDSAVLNGLLIGSLLH